jgi:hypothetical protein
MMRVISSDATPRQWLTPVDVDSALPPVAGRTLGALSGMPVREALSAILAEMRHLTDGPQLSQGDGGRFSPAINPVPAPAAAARRPGTAGPLVQDAASAA